MVKYQIHFGDALWSHFLTPSTTSPVRACITSECSYESSTLVVGARRRAIFLADATDSPERCIVAGEQDRDLILRGERIAGVIAVLLLSYSSRRREYSAP